MNAGSGVPCTIRRLMGKELSDPPDELLEAEQVKHDFKDKTDQVGKKLENYRQRIEDILDKKNITQADRKEVLSHLSTIVQEVRSNLPFWLDQFHEATTKICERREDGSRLVHHARSRTRRQEGTRNVGGRRVPIP